MLWKSGKLSIRSADRGPRDFTELCLTLGSQMLLCGGKGKNAGGGEGTAAGSHTKRRALEKLADMVEAQGGSREDVYHPENLANASLQIRITAPDSGYIRHIACDEIGMCSLMLGGGREKKEDVIDLTVGFELCRKVGEYVEKGGCLAVMHANDPDRAAAARSVF